MQESEWQELDFNDLEDDEQFEKKKSKKINRRKWREIEAFKEQKRMQQELASYEDYVMH